MLGACLSWVLVVPQATALETNTLSRSLGLMVTRPGPPSAAGKTGATNPIPHLVLGNLFEVNVTGLQ